MSHNDFLQAFLKFIASSIAAFGSGWATAVLSDVTHEKAIASGVVAFCAYVLGNQQSPLRKPPND
jgi:hypothetical protein